MAPYWQRELLDEKQLDAGTQVPKQLSCAMNGCPQQQPCSGMQAPAWISGKTVLRIRSRRVLSSLT